MSYPSPGPSDEITRCKGALTSYSLTHAKSKLMNNIIYIVGLIVIIIAVLSFFGLR
jgi:hypothetical protein